MQIIKYKGNYMQLNYRKTASISTEITTIGCCHYLVLYRLANPVHHCCLLLTCSEPVPCFFLLHPALLVLPNTCTFNLYLSFLFFPSTESSKTVVYIHFSFVICQFNYETVEFRNLLLLWFYYFFFRFLFTVFSFLYYVSITCCLLINPFNFHRFSSYTRF